MIYSIKGRFNPNAFEIENVCTYEEDYDVKNERSFKVEN